MTGVASHSELATQHLTLSVHTHFLNLPFNAAGAHYVCRFRAASYSFPLLDSVMAEAPLINERLANKLISPIKNACFLTLVGLLLH